ncbi:hypothetical protein SAMN05216184_101686 [Georgenia satyanarayanai]|uniref:Uncharacterized protein n=1 Tax=Georgenia satyanarayanai TaxID=860221 RepID=A0A2Y8ZXK3_9MICO|nr:hypothetical protein [Georgenia satyanarayanai]PYG02214.1 hypothetical protein A8987_101686 [Georgenia satyanarayanai]SSA37050.1 hypothetical protein SAMN05216184_101686 [Georgenia satyanarayanai]
MSNVPEMRAAEAEDRSRGQQVVSMLLTLVVVAALVPGAAVLALTWLVRLLAAGWGPVLGGALFACTWPLVDRAWRELSGRAPELPLGLPGWVWLGAAGTLGCWLLL